MLENTTVQMALNNKVQQPFLIKWPKFSIILWKVEEGRLVDHIHLLFHKHAAITYYMSTPCKDPDRLS